MSPPPYTTIPLRPLHPLHPLVWPFCTKDNVPTTIYHYFTASTAYCIHCILCPLHPLVWPFCTKDNVHTTIYHYSTVSTAYCIHCIHWFDLFAPKTMSPPPYTTIPLYPLHTASIASTGLTFLHQRQWPHHHIPLFHYIHCVLHPLHPLHPLVWPFCTKDDVSTTIYHYSTASTAYCILHPLVWPFCTKNNVPTTIYHYSTAYCVHCVHCVHWFFPTTHIYCVHCMTHCIGDLFALKVMVPTTHICWIHCVSWPFCTNTYCIHCIHCYPTYPTR